MAEGPERGVVGSKHQGGWNEKLAHLAFRTIHIGSSVSKQSRPLMGGGVLPALYGSYAHELNKTSKATNKAHNKSICKT